MDFPDHHWASHESIRAQCCYSRGQVQPPVSLWFRSQNQRFQVSSRLLGFLSSLAFLLYFHKSFDIANLTWSSSIPGFNLSCRLKLDSSNPSTSSNTNICSEWFVSPRIAIEMSDYTAGNSALSGLRFFISIPRFGADMIRSYFPSESNATIACTNFSPSERCAYPGDSANTAPGVILVKAPSFRVSTTSPIDSRISFIAGYSKEPNML